MAAAGPAPGTARAPFPLRTLRTASGLEGSGRRGTRQLGGAVDETVLHTDPEAEARRIRSLQRKQEQDSQQAEQEAAAADAEPEAAAAPAAEAAEEAAAAPAAAGEAEAGAEKEGPAAEREVLASMENLPEGGEAVAKGPGGTGAAGREEDGPLCQQQQQLGGGAEAMEAEGPAAAAPAPVAWAPSDSDLAAARRLADSLAQRTEGLVLEAMEVRAAEHAVLYRYSSGRALKTMIVSSLPCVSIHPCLSSLPPTPPPPAGAARQAERRGPGRAA